MDSSFEKSVNKLPKAFWVIGILGLLWNLMGLGAFFYDMTISDEAIAALDPAMQEMYATTPIISKIGYGIATICGTLGCVLLLLRKKIALPVFIVSLIGVAVQNIANFSMTNAMEVVGGSGLSLLLLVIAFAVFLVTHSKKAIDHNWIT